MVHLFYFLAFSENNQTVVFSSFNLNSFNQQTLLLLFVDIFALLVCMRVHVKYIYLYVDLQVVREGRSDREFFVSSVLFYLWHTKYILEYGFYEFLICIILYSQVSDHFCCWLLTTH